MKKLLFIGLIVLNSLFSIGQNAISELNKGLIFHAPLSEWYPDVDLISGARSTNTDNYPVIGRDGSGRRWYEFDGVDDYVSLPTIPVFGTADFSVVLAVRFNDASSIYGIIGGATGSFGLVRSNDDLKFRAIKTTDNTGMTRSVGILSNNVNYVISYVRISGKGRYYINGVFDSEIDDANDYTELTTRLGNYATSAFHLNGSISMVRIFNYALTPTQIANYSKPSYPIEWVDRGATGVELVTNGDFASSSGWTQGGWTIGSGVATAGGTANVDPLRRQVAAIAGRIYRVSKTVTGTVNYLYFSETSISTTTGVVTCTATTSNTNIEFYGSNGAIVDDVSAVQLGCVLDLNAEGMSANWVDKTNSLTATVSGATVVIPPASNLGATMFNGTTSKVVFASIQDLPTGGADISMSCWVNWDGSDYFPLIETGGSGGAHYYPYINGSGYLSLGTANVSTTAIIRNTWNHVGFVFSNGSLTYYINGIKINTVSFTLTASNSTTYIGSWAPGTTYFGRGVLSNIYLFKTKLTDDQIKLLYDLGH